jgi:hypothetical protein
MSPTIEISQTQEDLRVPVPHTDEPPPPDRDAALQEIQRLMAHWQLAPEELVDPADRQAALGKARRLVDFWRITPAELEGPVPPRPVPPPQYRYTHPKTGETWDGRGPQPACCAAVSSTRATGSTRCARPTP